MIWKLTLHSWVMGVQCYQNSGGTDVLFIFRISPELDMSLITLLVTLPMLETDHY